MEAALRTAYYKLTGEELMQFQIPAIRGMEGRKEAKVEINGMELGVAVVSGLANAAKLLDEIKAGKDDVHFIEVMACPGGCINGGGQCIGADMESIKARMQSIYDIDEKETIKVSHKNPEVIELYENYLGDPLGHKSHHLLHTKYNERNVLK
jgi:iron only hydrogenase large subunit-like protein